MGPTVEQMEIPAEATADQVLAQIHTLKAARVESSRRWQLHRHAALRFVGVVAFFLILPELISSSLTHTTKVGVLLLVAATVIAQQLSLRTQTRSLEQLERISLLLDQLRVRSQK